VKFEPGFEREGLSTAPAKAPVVPCIEKIVITEFLDVLIMKAHAHRPTAKLTAPRLAQEA
jgi:hypothetical protein